MINRLARQFIWVRRQAVYCMNEPADLSPTSARRPLQFISVTSENVGRAADFRSNKVVESFRRLLKHGDAGLFALDSNDRVVGHVWAEFCRDPACRGRGYFPMQRGDAMIHYANVAPEMRGKNVYPAMLTVFVHKLFDEHQVQRIVIDTETGNTPARRSIEKVGFQYLGVGTYVQLFRRLVFARLGTPA